MAYTPMKYNFQPIKQGTDWTRPIVFSTSGVENDLTDYTAKFTIRDEPHSGGALVLQLSGTPTANGSFTDVTGGTVTVTITDLDLDNFTQDELYYELRITSPVGGGSLESAPLYGTLTILRSLE